MEWKKVSVNSARGTGTHPMRAAKRNKRMKKTADSLRDFQDNIKQTNISNRGVPEEEREKWSEYLLEQWVKTSLTRKTKTARTRKPREFKKR